MLWIDNETHTIIFKYTIADMLGKYTSWVPMFDIPTHMASECILLGKSQRSP